MSGGLESGLGAGQIPLGGIGAPGQLGVGSAGILGATGDGGGGDTLGSFIKAMNLMNQEGGVKELANRAAQKSTAPILPEQPPGRFGDTLSEVAQPLADAPQSVGEELGKVTPELGGTAEVDEEVEKAAGVLGLTSQQAQILSQLASRPAPNIPRPLTPPRRAGSIAAGSQFGVTPLAQQPRSLAQILGRV